MPRTYRRSVDLEVSADRAWEWHARPGALERLIPPWEDVEVLSRRGSIRDGDRTELRLRLGPIRLHWTAVHRESIPGQRFTDVQERGPFASWTHQHRFEGRSESHCRLVDDIRYELPGGYLASALARPFMDRRLERTFAYRHRITSADLQLHDRYLGERQQRVLVTGATGLVGSAVTALFMTGGHRVTRLLRSPPRDGDAPESDHVLWNPAAGDLDPADVSGYDIVIHLAGENIGGGRWTPERKSRIRDSRVVGTTLLSRALAAAESPPRVLVCASAVGFYGDRGDLEVDEGSGPGQGFLAETCVEWEESAQPARVAGIRVVHLRIGVVLTPAGGALQRMLPPFLVGLGGPLGSGRQFMSWITLDDLLSVIVHAAATEELRGPVNAVTPAAVRNREFTRSLARVLGRPAFLQVPEAALHFLLGREMADELLLGGARVVPRRLTDTGFEFGYPTLKQALRHVLGRVGKEGP